MSNLPNPNDKKFDLKKILSFFIPIITPVLALSMPGYAVLFYYQIHIGNLPSFLSTINTSIFVLFGVISVVLYTILLFYGMLSSFWLYMIINYLVSKFGKNNNFTIANIIPKKKSECAWYFMISFLVLLIVIINLIEMNANRYSIALYAYFFIVGAFFVAALDKISKQNLKKSLILISIPVACGLMLPVFLQGAVPMMAEDFVSIVGMRTKNFDNLYISEDKYQEIEALLSAFDGVEKNVCSMVIGGRDFVNVTIKIDGDNVPLVVLWNDNSDHKIVGFDNRWTSRGQFDFPTFSVSNADILEFPKNWVKAC
ncbi:hypothetical protein AA23498_3315 [Acetobacter nitrogenifigens DSM 23921 = NBRC 105050]|uniref:hypothetical protein n=1 Tax=Acetobacter nitrogenifigens TaxID=285268 RepID=UPI0011BFCAB3|nr:hypothetical protein [Acetobacter nitrogenifigens]GBQ98784.1 hypothetical protein AA23498_3315 [Acetobacter nitrogenifigens DSM 23921 = NBRC 105050]